MKTFKVSLRADTGVITHRLANHTARALLYSERTGVELEAHKSISMGSSIAITVNQGSLGETAPSKQYHLADVYGDGSVVIHLPDGSKAKFNIHRGR